ncbi:MAG TPA: mannitol dehydrogenase family protein [Natronosporangium sp.]|nr:mannitol dehydrogenase family protein [Natronosporangium sp.]
MALTGRAGSGVVTGQPRLSAATLRLVPACCRPRIRPGDVKPGIVHLGLGAFHRAHQAVYTEDAIAAGGGDWGIVGVAPRRRELVDELAAQDGLFSVTQRDGTGAATRVVGSLCAVAHAPSDPGRVVALLADPATRVVTLTVTEKAYRLDPATGRLQVDEALRAELTGRALPASIPGLLVAGLAARYRTAAAPVALVSCDNLPTNGRRLRSAVLQALEVAGPDAAAVGDWVRRHVSFPHTMVDRIVPATTAATLEAARSALGVTDLAAVVTEPFRQWVIEDDFPAGRPRWEAAGAILTDDAGPYERLKLRCLNGVHSALAYLGALAGCDTIAEALELPGLRDVLERFIAEEVAPSLDPPDGVVVTEYGRSVLARFANPAIQHSTRQVAMDGSQKLPQRLLHTIADRRAAGATPRWGTLMVAAWMRFVTGYDDHGRPLPLRDPLAGKIRAALTARGGADASPAAVVDALLGLDQIFPPELAGDPVVRQLLVGWLGELSRHGVRGTLAGTEARR